MPHELPPLPKRRVSDVVTLETLDTRVAALEDGYEMIRHTLANTVNELRAATALVEDVHGAVFDEERGLARSMGKVREAVFGDPDDEKDHGLQGKVTEVHDIVTDAKRVIRLANAVADVLTSKPVLIVFGVGTAILAYMKTGTWTLPDWWPK